MRNISVFLALFSSFILSLAQAQAAEGARARARSVVEIVTDNSFLNTFPKEAYTPINAQVTGNAAAAALELYFGSRLMSGGLKFNGVPPFPKTAHYVKFYSGLLLVVDGVVRAYISVNGREATLFPILTYMGGSISGHDVAVSSSFTEKNGVDGMVKALIGPDSFQVAGSSFETLFGALLMAVGDFAPALDPKVKRVLKIAGPILFMDGALRLGSAISPNESQNLLPILDFAKDRVQDGLALQPRAGEQPEKPAGIASGG